MIDLPRPTMHALAVLLGAAIVFTMRTTPAMAQIDIDRDGPCCEMNDPTVVWLGDDSTMTLGKLAAHAAPILWFSPDEPLLYEGGGDAPISIPAALPFETPSATPIVYYRIRTVIQGGQATAFDPEAPRSSDSVIDLDRVSAINLDYFFYYPSEEGFGRHAHDVESVEVKLAVFRQTNCVECRYGISVRVVNAKAHGLLWYDNTLVTDSDTRFPITILVEEGKHASCTDKNGDGYYTPGYDVNQRVNDAWGVRDVLRTGALFTGQFQGWFAKVRDPRHRVFPPLPAGNRHRDRLREEMRRTQDPVVYALRTWPSVEDAVAYDPTLRRFVDKGHPDWPEVQTNAELDQLLDWVDSEYFVKSLSLAARYDGNVGLSFVFPLLVVKNVNVGATGGWLVNRVYLTDTRLRDIGWTLLYTPSASRWLDSYASAGFEIDRSGGTTPDEHHFVTELGIKLRANVSHSPLSFLSVLSDFLGLRLGIRYHGFERFDELGYVVEFGAGAF